MKPDKKPKPEEEMTSNDWYWRGHRKGKQEGYEQGKLDQSFLSTDKNLGKNELETVWLVWDYFDDEGTLIGVYHTKKDAENAIAEEIENYAGMQEFSSEDDFCIVEWEIGSRTERLKSQLSADRKEDTEKQDAEYMEESAGAFDAQKEGEKR